jgi:hypothetical protein
MMQKSRINKRKKTLSLRNQSRLFINFGGADRTDAQQAQAQLLSEYQKEWGLASLSAETREPFLKKLEAEYENTFKAVEAYLIPIRQQLQINWKDSADLSSDLAGKYNALQRILENIDLSRFRQLKEKEIQLYQRRKAEAASRPKDTEPAGDIIVAWGKGGVLGVTNYLLFTPAQLLEKSKQNPSIFQPEKVALAIADAEKYAKTPVVITYEDGTTETTNVNDVDLRVAALVNKQFEKKNELEDPAYKNPPEEQKLEKLLTSVSTTAKKNTLKIGGAPGVPVALAKPPAGGTGAGTGAERTTTTKTNPYDIPDFREKQMLTIDPNQRVVILTSPKSIDGHYVARMLAGSKTPTVQQVQDAILKLPEGSAPRKSLEETLYKAELASYKSKSYADDDIAHYGENIQELLFLSTICSESRVDSNPNQSNIEVEGKYYTPVALRFRYINLTGGADSVIPLLWTKKGMPCKNGHLRDLLYELQQAFPAGYGAKPLAEQIWTTEKLQRHFLDIIYCVFSDVFLFNSYDAFAIMSLFSFVYNKEFNYNKPMVSSNLPEVYRDDVSRLCSFGFVGGIEYIYEPFSNAFFFGKATLAVIADKELAKQAYEIVKNKTPIDNGNPVPFILAFAQSQLSKEMQKVSLLKTLKEIFAYVSLEDLRALQYYLQITDRPPAPTSSSTDWDVLKVELFDSILQKKMTILRQNATPEEIRDAIQGKPQDRFPLYLRNEAYKNLVAHYYKKFPERKPTEIRTTEIPVIVDAPVVPPAVEQLRDDTPSHFVGQKVELKGLGNSNDGKFATIEAISGRTYNVILLTGSNDRLEVTEDNMINGSPKECPACMTLLLKKWGEPPNNEPDANALRADFRKTVAARS